MDRRTLEKIAEAENEIEYIKKYVEGLKLLDEAIQEKDADKYNKYNRIAISWTSPQERDRDHSVKVKILLGVIVIMILTCLILGP